MRYGLLSAALAVFAVSVLLSLGKLRQSHEAALETSGVSLWLAFQADYELQRLLHALDLRALGEGQVGHDELVARLDIFWSRLPLLIQGQDSSAITRVTVARALVSDMISQLERIEPALLALQPGDRAAYAEVRRRLAQFQEPLRQLSLEIDQTLGREQARLQEQVSGLYSGHAMYMVGILGSSAVFIFLLILESARTRRLLAAIMAARARVAHLAHHDALTDLPNRILFQDRLQQALARASRQNNWIAIHCLDLDHFKNVNDRHGHAIGDAILIAATRRILPCLRKSDTLARLGGDEFAVIQTDLHDAPGAALLARRMIQALLQPFAVEDRVLSLSASIGIALFPDDGRESAQLLRHADAALYEAKAAGRGTARFYSSEMSREARARHRIEQDLLAAIRSGDLELHYQPRYTAIGQRLVGMEALLRWNRPGYGMLQPEDFVPIAEQCGLIAAIGSWVIRTACAQNRRWQEAGFPALRVAVNLSPAQFAAQDLVSEICAILKETGLEAQHLELEITDSVLLHETQRNLATLNELRALGLHLSLDDFGAGYSRLNYLLSFRFETLKLDRSFVRNLGTGGPGEPVCRALLAMAHSLNMAVVAEGVETADQLAGLEAIGCDQCQGSYFGAPEPARAFERRLCALMAA